MTRLAHAVATIVVTALALVCTAAVFFGMFTFGMGMGAFSGTAFDRFSTMAEVAMLWSLLAPPVVLAIGAVLTVKDGPIWFHGVGFLAGCGPLALFWAATTVLY